MKRKKPQHRVIFFYWLHLSNRMSHRGAKPLTVIIAPTSTKIKFPIRAKDRLLLQPERHSGSPWLIVMYGQRRNGGLSGSSRDRLFDVVGLLYWCVMSQAIIL